MPTDRKPATKPATRRTAIPSGELEKRVARLEEAVKHLARVANVAPVVHSILHPQGNTDG